jgi:molybdopterin molybdotransferase
MISYEEALNKLLAAAIPVEQTELVDTLHARDRVLRECLKSSMQVPPMDNSAMDGYALAFADLGFAQGPGLPISQRIPAGAQPHALAAKTCARIFTGAPIPLGADTVIMQERTVLSSQDVMTITDASGLQEGNAIRRAGEDIALGSSIAQEGSIITPVLAGLIASVGIAKVRVTRPLRVACFFTGDELTMPGQPLKPGAIYNSNRFVITGLLAQLGCQVNDMGIVPDNLEATKQALAAAAKSADLIVTSGGVSVGEEDHVKPALQALGELDLWQISMKPGKPLAYGRIGATHFIGLPGNPVSSYITFALLAKPFVRALQGASYNRPTKFKVQAAFDWPKPDKRREFLRAFLNQSGQLQLFRTQSSGALTSLAHSSGLIDNPPNQPIARGDWLDFLPFATLEA